MRKFAGPALMGIGVFLLVVGILALVWVPGAVKKTPLDVDTLTRLSGEAAKIDPATGSFEPRSITAMSVTQVDSEASTDDTAVWAQWSCATFADEDCIDPEEPNSVLVDEDELITASDTVFATDRVTAEGVASEDLPESVEDADGEAVVGLVNRFPFDTEQKDYPYWDGTLGESVDAVFDRTEEIEGLETYVFVVQSVDVPIDVAENTPGTYSSTKEIFVDPVTGSVINQTEQQERFLEDGTQVLDLSLAFTEDQVASNADDAKSNGRTLNLMTTILPLVGLIGGAVLIVVGFVLSRRGKGTHSTKADARPLVNP